MITAERRLTAAALDRLTDEQWYTAGLCAGWRTRAIVAHTTVAGAWPGMPTR